MIQVKADEVVTAFLGPIKEQVEVVDPNGKRLGRFIPTDPRDELLRQRMKEDYESGEYQRRKEKSANQPKYTTEQVLERLRSMDVS